MELLNALADEVLAELGATPRPRGGWLFDAVGGLAHRGGEFHLASGAPGVLGRLEVRPTGVIVLDAAVPPSRRLDRLDDPRCFGRLARSLADLAEASILRQFAAAESADDPVALQRTMALKAFRLGFDATRAGTRRATAESAEAHLWLLGADDAGAPRTATRMCFYALVAATCRLDEPGLTLRAAELGRGCGSRGGYSPFYPWHRIAEAVRRAGRAPVRRLRTGADAAAADRLRAVAEEASRLEPRHFAERAYYLRHASLEQLARHHGLA